MPEFTFSLFYKTIRKLKRPYFSATDFQIGSNMGKMYNIGTIVYNAKLIVQLKKLIIIAKK